MKIRLSLILVVLVAGCISSCTPKAKCVDSGGGKGGNGTITVSPTHYGSYVDSFKVFIKYGTLNAPANGIYDDSLMCKFTDTIPSASFTNLKPGLYYFYGAGYHTSLLSYVKGAVNYTMCTEHTRTMLLPTYTYNP